MLTPVKRLVQKKVINQIRVPEDIEAVVTYDLDRECDPIAAGMNPDQVDAIWKALINLYKTGMYPGISLCLRRHGKIVLNRSIGHASGNGPQDSEYSNKRLLTPDTPICLFSSSKAMTAVLMHILAERQQINLLDPISYYLPKFALHGKRDTTIFQLLSHQGGIPSVPPGTDTDLLFNADNALDILCEMKPSWQGGEKVGYHAVTGGFVFAEIVKAVTGEDIKTFLDETLRKPMGFRYFDFGAEEQDISKVATNYFTGLPVTPPFSTVLTKALGVPVEEVVKISNDPRFLQTVIPAANLIATGEEATAFYQMLLNGGEYNGQRVMEPVSVHRVIQPVTKMMVDSVLKLPLRYSAGLMLGSNPYSIYGANTRYAFGHLGFTNNFCWADRERDIAVSLLTTGNPVVGTHLGRLLGLMNQISKSCRTIVQCA